MEELEPALRGTRLLRDPGFFAYPPEKVYSRHYPVVTDGAVERTHGNLASWDNALRALGLEIVGRNLSAGETLGSVDPSVVWLP